MTLRSQSAMEYLTTYGWAILIIAVVLGALYQVGVFSPYTFSPKASPGSCSVERSQVAGVPSAVRVGSCNDALPQYVASFNGASVISVPTSSTLTTVNTTVSVWVRPSVLPQLGGMVSFSDCGTGGYFFTIGNGGGSTSYIDVPFGGNGQITDYVTGPIASSTWQNLAFTAAKTGASSSSITLYVNGVSKATYALSYAIASSPQSTLYLGAVEYGCGWPVGYLNGLMSNVQIYNTSLSANEISLIYYKGIGADPSNMRNLAAWWPLNGDASDYSGNGNDGTITGVTFTGSWVGGYSAP